MVPHALNELCEYEPVTAKEGENSLEVEVVWLKAECSGSRERMNPIKTIDKSLSP